ncbi:hypothetical protein DICPUDRAFT_151221 [Dictyostelium purpureum]|uniref:Uncharacterized protein n=1 Tax=Dictyostelium purpureum TaxID=5786 RepID=F0ZIA8_DICPU|nr:uncharacterized protein DICPUDRAFT_151221 [Dictyostelium purpureum]EGC36325.1 hypothetical protein DICPUDRAFT_151221 [Dictyostelium purpureum]|eukprot:XP_003287140.1 hypothetical protein DICPUDRAFT_151221 [Dictyostelium purpureum]
MNNSDIVKGALTTGNEPPTTISIESNGKEISDEYLEKEFQENTKDGPIYDLLKNIISMQQKTNVIITEFVNKEKIEKQQSQPQPQSKKSKGSNKGNNKQNNKQNDNSNNKRIDENKDDNDKIIKQPKLDN